MIYVDGIVQTSRSVIYCTKRIHASWFQRVSSHFETIEIIFVFEWENFPRPTCVCAGPLDDPVVSQHDVIELCYRDESSRYRSDTVLTCFILCNVFVSCHAKTAEFERVVSFLRVMVVLVLFTRVSRTSIHRPAMNDHVNVFRDPLQSNLHWFAWSSR